MQMKKTGVLGFLALMMGLLLAACGESHEAMLRQLEMLEQMNRADSVMTNDSLAEALTTYFDSHGTANERLRAHYILGRTYADMGEAPAALNAYLDAADCADTTATDCDYRTLSRVHAQSAIIYHRLVQPMGQLEELRLAQYYAWRGNDTLIAIQTYAQSSEPYAMRQQFDSAIYIREKAYQMYMTIGKSNWAAITLGGAITAALKLNDIERVKHYINVYETSSGLFNNGSIQKGRELYYYLKGEYYIVVNKLDSAEYQFRRLQRTGYTLNDQIAVCQGLQDLYKRLGNTDSVAKYAERCYQLNDSAYSLSEMENVQRLKASYNYNRNKLLAEEKTSEANKAKSLIIIIVFVAVFVILTLSFIFILYRKKKRTQMLQYQQQLAELEKEQTELMELRSGEKEDYNAVLERKEKNVILLQGQVAEHIKTRTNRTDIFEDRLLYSDVVKKLKELLQANPPQQATGEDIRQLKALINENIPSFYGQLCMLRPIEYEVCLLIRVHFLPSEICKLAGIPDHYISNLRKRILQKAYGINGSAKDLDTLILSIY